MRGGLESNGIGSGRPGLGGAARHESGEDTKPWTPSYWPNILMSWLGMAWQLFLQAEHRRESWSRRFATLRALLGGSSSARRINFGSPTSRTNCTPIRRFQKWMNLLQVINFVFWWCLFKILYCLEAQDPGDSWSHCEAIFKGGSKSARRASDGHGPGSIAQQLQVHRNGRISYRWCILAPIDENVWGHEFFPKPNLKVSTIPKQNLSHVSSVDFLG